MLIRCVGKLTISDKGGTAVALGGNLREEKILGTIREQLETEGAYGLGK